MIPTIFYILSAAVIIMLVSLSGLVLFIGNVSHWSKKHMKRLVSFSAGVFLLVAINLAQETFHLAPSATYAVLFILSGALIVYLLSFLLPDSHAHHHGEDDHDHDKSGARRLLIGDAIHNVADGILLAPTFLIDMRLGIATTIGIIIHEFIQEVSEFVVLKDAGYTTKQALVRNFATASTVLIGAVGGYFLTSSNTITAVLLGIAAGIFFYAVFVDLFPSTLDRKKPKASAQMLLWAVLGIVLIMGVNAVAGHEDAHNHDHGHDDTEEMHEKHDHDDEHAHEEKEETKDDHDDHGHDDHDEHDH